MLPIATADGVNTPVVLMPEPVQVPPDGVSVNVKADTGTTILTYSTNSSPTPSLCPSTSTMAVSVSSVTQPTISPAGPYCDNFSVQTMTVAPAVTGGTWTSTTSPTAISTSGQFNPTLATLGNSTIVYSVTSGPCTASTSINVNVVHFIPATITGALGHIVFIIQPLIFKPPLN